MDETYIENTAPETAVSSPFPVEDNPSVSPLPVETPVKGEEMGPGEVEQAPLEGPSFEEDGGGEFNAVVAVDYGAQLTVIQESLAAMQTHAARPLMTTPFEEYTVGEGLILLLLVFLVLQSLIKIVKVGFSWLLW